MSKSRNIATVPLTPVETLIEVSGNMCLGYWDTHSFGVIKHNYFDSSIILSN